MRNAPFSAGQALLLGMPLALFLGAFVSDLAFSRTYEIQWANFSAWLIAGALVFAGLLVVIAIVDLVRARGARSRVGLYIGLLIAIFVIGLVNALVHARDGWAMMPTGLILSLIVLVLTLAAAWVGLRRMNQVEER